MKHLKAIKAISLLGLVLLGTGHLAAEMQTLTNQQGQSITGEVLDVKGNTVKIKRADGQIFSIPLDTLSLADQKKILADEATRPPAVGALKVELSRGKFSSSSKSEDVTLTTGRIVKNGLTTTDEKWGYSVTLSNSSPKPMDALRIEYQLFATQDSMAIKDEKMPLKKTSYQATLAAIPTLGKITFRTETVSALQMKFVPGIISGETGRTESGERLYGVWLRVYKGTHLIHEVSAPETLRTKETW